MITFNNKHELKTWLNKHNIDTTLWGTGPTKTVQNLWDEYANGDIILEESPLLRKVQVVQIMLRRDKLMLLEIEQELADGRRRSRKALPAEKMKRGESVATAVARCLHEELSVDQKEIAFIAAEHQKSERIEASPSYPGLLTHYTFYKVKTTANNLPEIDFWRENVASGSEHDPVRRHLWGWREVVQ